MKLLYVAKSLPFEAGEAFVLEEVLDHVAHGCDVWLAPVGGGRIVHDNARPLLDRTLHTGLFSGRALLAALKAVVTRPRSVFSLLATVLTQSDWRLLPRNLAVFPKGLWLGEQARRHGFDHIHAHWIAVPATMAMIAARMASIPFSITAHRYDIMQANLVPAKFRESSFVRAINRRGAQELDAQLPTSEPQAWCLPMGVHLPCAQAERRHEPLQTMRAIIGARLIAVKDHAMLIDAVALARDRGRDIHLDIFGDGPLESALRCQVATAGLSGQVEFCGVVSHHRLTEALIDSQYDVAVLPSRTLADGTKEGIPVFLMEAMAAGLPVVTTPCGGIPELVDDNCGRVVPEGNATALADALVELMDDGDLRARLARNARAKVAARHDMTSVGDQLRRRFQTSGKTR